MSGEQRVSIGMDVGGSLAKFVLFEEPEEGTDGSSSRHPLEDYIRKAVASEARSADRSSLPEGWFAQAIRPGSSQGSNDDERQDSTALYALRLPTSDLPELFNRVGAQNAGDLRLRVAATGGGTLKFKAELEEQLRVEIAFVHELKAIARGLPKVAGQRPSPALLCSVGTGVSLIHISDSNGGFERVSGSGIGASTFWNLARRLTSYTDFEAAVTQPGDAQKVDVLVGDVYGVETSREIGMPPELVAGFLGKLGAPGVADRDVVAALLRMFTNNLGQLAVFQARLLELSEVWFCGGCFGASEADEGSGAGRVVRRAVADAVGFWSAGKVKALFPGNASFLGAVGAATEASNSGSSKEQ
ncbi:fumble-domain-containing protein [Coemansia spiralis]|nr:fumble-domain-containing protein [Coemansia spiralis]